MRPIYELTRKENSKPVLFEWMPAKQKAFEAIKSKLAIALVIVYLNFNKPFILYTDISGRGVGVVLHQKGNDRRE